ncbi:stalk domain-containing protein [Acetoanaerobium sticklandii]|uniref:stalk domain-containing protein n=1 Tax=Acetoanaerobium sticklandii TaxID=1511 RepID=UPI003A8C973D
MKKILAIALGLFVGLSTFSYATPKVVEAYLQNDFLIKVNGEFKYHPEGLKPLVYQNRTYLPASYIAQLLGANTTFDSDTKTVSINSNPDVGIEQEKIKEYEEKIKILEEKIEKLESSTSANSDYTKLPARIAQNGYKLTLEGLSIREEGNDGRLYFTLENEDADTGVKIDAMSTIIETNTDKYEASFQFQENLDRDLFKWIRRNEELKTYIPFSKLPEDDKEIREMTVTVVLEINETYPKKETLTFKVLND